jgi:thiol-disulfide isomerase/thioredoxin
MNNKFTLTSTLIAFILSFTTFSTYAQDSIQISGQLLNNSRYAKVVVKQYGIGEFAIGAFPIDKETGKFSIVAPKEVTAGIYRLQYSQTENEYVDVIINGKEPIIDFSIDINIPFKDRLPVFSKSAENMAWYSFKQELQYQNTLITPQFQFLGTYPNTKDKVYQLVQKEYQLKKTEYQNKRNTFIKSTPYYWAKQMAQFENTYFPNPTEHYRLQEFYAHENFWEGIPTQDELLINTPLYTQSILSYIQYYMNPDIGFSEEEATVGFKKCVDVIMKQFDGNEKTKEFALKYLQLGFKEIGNEAVLQYIDQNYAAAAQCTDDDDELKKRLAGYEAMKPGMLAPNIAFNVNSSEVLTTGLDAINSLYDIKAEQTLVVFWASWCPHCMEELPKLNEWAKNNPTTKVVAISLDEDKTAYQTAIANFGNLSHYCDFKKWDSKAVADYYVYGTPTFFVLDKDKKIIGKYADFKSVNNINK